VEGHFQRSINMKHISKVVDRISVNMARNQHST